MNSSIEIKDAITILEKLVNRTREGKLQWQLNGNGYTTTLEPNFRVELSEGMPVHASEGFTCFSLVEFDPRYIAHLLGTVAPVPEKEVIRVLVEKNPPYGFDSVQEKRLAELLVDMNALARRSALGLNSSMQRALTYLDKIAG